MENHNFFSMHICVSQLRIKLGLFRILLKSQMGKHEEINSWLVQGTLELYLSR